MDKPEEPKKVLEVSQRNRRAADLVPPLNCPYLDYTPPLPGANGLWAKELRKQLHVLVTMTVILYLVLGAIVWWIWAQQSVNTHALCAVRRASLFHLNSEQALLRNNPTGVFGISPEQIQQEIDQYYNLVISLQGLSNDC